MYKCGTSWLLSVLSAHPDAMGLREFDIVRSSVDHKSPLLTLREEHDRLSRFFSGHSYCKMSSGQLALLEKGDPSWLQAEEEPRRRRDTAGPITFHDLSAEAKQGLYRAVKNAVSPSLLIDSFLTINGAFRPEATHLVVKSAEQVPVFDALQELAPPGKKIVIIRDGRDAAISAMHYRKLMVKENAPWAKGSRQFMELLQGWVSRAKMAKRLLDERRIYVLRYEDLTLDFPGTLMPLLAWLDMPNDQNLVDSINSRTSFEALTGRTRGEEAESVLRKGAIREWMGVLSDNEKAEAWEVAGTLLREFGYTQDGSLDPL